MVLFCLVDLKPNSLLAERQNKKIEERAQRYESRKDSEQKNLERMCCMQTFPSNLTFIIIYQSILSCPEMSDFSGERHNSSDANFREKLNNV